MSNLVLRIVVVPATALLAALSGTALAAAAGPSSTLTVQDAGIDGAAVRTGSAGVTDADGTQGDYKDATDGTVSGPIEFAVPQFKASAG